MGLILAILVLALIAGVLGRVLKLAFWLISVLVIVGAVLGALVYYGFKRASGRA